MYEWDETKRETNLRKHHLDFADAYMVYEHPGKITIDSPRGSESRHVDLALVELAGRVLALIYTKRGESVRIISFRIASREERRLYESIKLEDEH